LQICDTAPEAGTETKESIAFLLAAAIMSVVFGYIRVCARPQILPSSSQFMDSIVVPAVLLGERGNVGGRHDSFFGISLVVVRLGFPPWLAPP